jgi:uncharacterized protein (TIGR03437 family)
MMALLSVVAAGSLRAQLTLGVSPTAIALSAQSGSVTPVTATLSISSSGDSLGTHLSYATVNTGGTSGSTVWLTFANGTGTTPGAITVSANPTGLADGSYSGLILVYASTATNSPVNVPVTFTIGQLGATPASLNFSYQTGGSIPAAQAVTITGPSASIGFTAAATVPSGSLWLEVAPNSGTTPEVVNINLNSAVVATLADGTYSGTVVVTPASGSTTPLNVPVTLTVSATPEVTTAPASLAFLFETGGSNNVTQHSLALSTSGAPASFTAAASVNPNSANVAWLSVSPASGVTPAGLAVSVSPGALPAGTYAGAITISVQGAAAVTVNVTLTVSASPLLVLSPASLTFTYQTGAALPAPQNITPTSTGAALSYTAAATTTSGGSWLSVTGGGTTPNAAAVSVDPAGLAVGTYSGTISVTAASSGNSPQQVPVTLTVTDNALVEATPSPLIFLYQIGKTAPASQSVAVTSSTGATLNYAVADSTAAGGSWLTVTPVSGATTGTLTVSVITAGLVAGTYTGSIVVTATNPSGVAVSNSPLTIPVTYYVSENPLVQVSPNPLSFTATAGGLANGENVLVTSTSTTLNYTITSTTTTGGSWLAVSSVPGSTPGSFPVSAIAYNLGAGTYNGSITITATNPAGEPVANSPVTIPVKLQVSLATLSAAPASLAFTQTVGGAAPPTQTISVSGAGAASLSFTATATNSSGVNWLTVTPAAGSTPGTLTVAVNGSNLSQGTYVGTVSISSPGAAGSPQAIPVTLTVSSTASISVTPAALTFNYQAGGATPAAQTVQVAASSGTLPFTAAAATNGNSGNWLAVSANTTSGILTIGVTPAGLAAGTYTGQITVAATGAGNSPQVVAVTLVVTPGATSLPTIVQSAASEAPGPVAPGEIISIFGTNLGPTPGVAGTIANNLLSTQVSGIQVMFDNNPAPLLYVSATQINAIVPFALNGLNQTHLTISNNGSVSNPLDLVVAPTAPALFTTTQTGGGQGAILNANGSVNTSANPAAAGSIIVLYATGGGETSPLGVTGNITPTDGTGLKLVPGVTVTVGNLAGTVVYAGSAPGFVEGALQINVQLPANLPAGAQAVVMTVGGVSSPAGVTVAVQ